MYYTYTPSFENDHNRVDWFFIVKTKLNSHIEVEVNGDDNNEVFKWDDVFQIDVIVVSYQVTPFNYLKNTNFHIVENAYIDVDVDEWNYISSTSRHYEVEEDDEIKKTLNSTKKMMKMKRRSLIKWYYINLDVIQSSCNTICCNFIMHCIFYICCGFGFNVGNCWL